MPPHKPVAFSPPGTEASRHIAQGKGKSLSRTVIMRTTVKVIVATATTMPLGYGIAARVLT